VKFFKVNWQFSEEKEVSLVHDLQNDWPHHWNGIQVNADVSFRDIVNKFQVKSDLTTRRIYWDHSD